MSETTAEQSKGVAGRTNYADWDKLATDLVKTTEQEEEDEQQESKAALGLDGKYAYSRAEAEEREKAQQVQQVKKTLEGYQKREAMVVSEFDALLGPAPSDDDDNGAAPTTVQESKATDAQTIRITRADLDAGRRVVSIKNTSGASVQDMIVLTQDLSHLESKIAANSMVPIKSYAEDAENNVNEENESGTKQRSVFGIIKAFVQNVHNCTILVKCKIISGTIELHHCSNVVVKIASEATVATLQVDLSKDITIEFHDAPSGKNVAGVVPGQKKMFWGEDKDDRIFHAGVSNLRVKLVRDGFVEAETTADFIKDGAQAIGNATAEEMQFITSCVDGELRTESVARVGSSTGKNVRAMTERELKAEQEMRAKAVEMATEKAEQMISIQSKNGELVKKVEPKPASDEIVEVLSPEVDAVVKECEANKARGNEAFGAGEYGQAILLYSLALDKAEELPPDSKVFPKDIVFSNRAACFLKLGQHEKAAADASAALKLNPNNIKALFRQGLSLHAMKRFEEALPILAKAHKIEPKNKQIKQALQFSEVRLEQERRRRAQG